MKDNTQETSAIHDILNDVEGAVAFAAASFLLKAKSISLKLQIPLEQGDALLNPV